MRRLRARREVSASWRSSGTPDAHTQASRRAAYVVIYEYKADEVTIMRILHASRRWEDLI